MKSGQARVDCENGEPAPTRTAEPACHVTFGGCSRGFCASLDARERTAIGDADNPAPIESHPRFQGYVEWGLASGSRSIASAIFRPFITFISHPVDGEEENNGLNDGRRDTAPGYKENLLDDGMQLNYALMYPIERS